MFYTRYNAISFIASNVFFFSMFVKYLNIYRQIKRVLLNSECIFFKLKLNRLIDFIH